MKNFYIDEKRVSDIFIEPEWGSEIKKLREPVCDPMCDKFEKRFLKFLFNDHILFETGDIIYVNIELDTDTDTFEFECLVEYVKAVIDENETCDFYVGISVRLLPY